MRPWGRRTEADVSTVPSADREQDYVLGTHNEELERLGLQHRVWQPTVLDCWRQAGITRGWRVLDVGAGPGYAAVDLAEMVGATGRVVAVERSRRFVESAREACRARGLAQVEVVEMDLMTDPLPAQDMDASWCRWVAAFVSSPAALVAKLAAALRPGGVAIFHEYANYASWRFAPRSPALEEFVRQAMANWRAAGGEPDIALDLPALLAAEGFRIRHAMPRIFCARPRDPVWQWPASFIGVHLDRLLELGNVTESWATSVRRDLEERTADENSLVLTPLLLEIVAERL
jgi:SAM-dependent methyltransferase